MYETKALDHFRGPRRVNCAQAVLMAFREEYDVPEALIDTARGCGGGKAPEGECGAYHAAKLLLAGEDDRLQRLHDEFIHHGGDIRCRPIRKTGRLDCNNCVKLAARVVAEGMQASD